jgi:eukaryotic-like serine/threonine-protein kinase
MGDYTVGQKLGDYEILGVLGAGGMGKVYQVRNTISDRVEAMKILLPNLADQKELAERFLREIKLLAGLSHPNIAELRTALTLDNQLVMIMEYVDGVTLASRLHQGPVPVPDAVNYIDQVLSALAYAHQLNIVHRDIKPANMMLTRQGVVKLMDFGIARSDHDSNMTITGTTLGSLNYMSPEQVRGETVDARSDLYSVGLSLYELLTGRLPFHGDTRYSLMVAQLQQAPEPPIVLRPDVPKALNDIILMVLAKDPAQRFQSATAFRNALKSAVPQAAAAAAGAASPSASLSGSTGAYSANTVLDPSPGTSAPAAVRPPTAPLRPPTQPAPAAAAPVLTSAPPSAKIEAAPPPVPRSHRGLYVALGGVLVVAMLAGAAVYVPHRVKTHAATGTVNASQPASQVAPAAESPAPAAAPVDQPAAAPAAAAPAQPAAAPSAGNSQAKATHASPAAAAKNTGQSAAQSAAPNADAQASAAQPDQATADDQAKAAELEAASRQFDQLNSRAAAIESSLDALKRQQANQGYGLRGDMVAAQQRMNANLAQAQSALQQQDAASAKRYLDMADRDAEKLERFLGQ